MWASHTAKLHRTTNNCEYFYSHFNQTFSKAHPSLFTFLQIVKHKIQRDPYIKISSIQHNIKKIPMKLISTLLSKVFLLIIRFFKS
jgi:hypothetical protein